MEQTFFSVMFWMINMLYWPYHLYFINSTLPCSMKTSQYVKECIAVKVKVAQSCLTLRDPMDYTVHVILQARILLSPGIKSRSPALQADSLPPELPGKPKNTGVSSLSLLQRIFQIQESNWDLLWFPWILYHLSYQGRTALEGWFLTTGPPGNLPVF